MWSSTPWYALSLALALLAAPVRAEVPARVSAWLPEAQLSGSGRLTWFGLHVYDAALYLPAGVPGPDYATHPFVLELTYARELRGVSIAEASRDEIARLGFGSAAQRLRWFEQMSALFPDVRARSRIAGQHLPGRGARFFVDGRLAGEIADPEFATAFFSIWLDERSRSPALRRALLAGGGR